MVTIRLARHGAKKSPFYHVTVAEKSAKRDGRFIERIGFYNPLARGGDVPLKIDLARLDHWLANGAQPTARVRRLAARVRHMPVAAMQPAAQPVASASVAEDAASEPEAATEAEAVPEVEDAPATEAAPATDQGASAESTSADATATEPASGEEDAAEATPTVGEGDTLDETAPPAEPTAKAPPAESP